MVYEIHPKMNSHRLIARMSFQNIMTFSCVKQEKFWYSFLCNYNEQKLVLQNVIFCGENTCGVRSAGTHFRGTKLAPT